MRLEDLATIIITMAELAIALVVSAAIYAAWPRPWSDLALIGRALWHRYVGDWPSLVERIADMSNDDDAVPVNELVRADRVLPDTYQVRDASVGAIANRPDPARDIISRRMPRTDLITLLAVQRNESGGYLWSKNQIAAFIGGTRADTLKLIGEARGEHQGPPQYRPLDQDSKPILRS
jgi:hypothetical protein